MGPSTKVRQGECPTNGLHEQCVKAPRLRANILKTIKLLFRAGGGPVARLWRIRWAEACLWYIRMVHSDFFAAVTERPCTCNMYVHALASSSSPDWPPNMIIYAVCVAAGSAAGLENMFKVAVTIAEYMHADVCFLLFS